MKRNKIRYDRWLRTLFLAFALLTGGGGWMVWGQTTPKGPVTNEENRPSIILNNHSVDGKNWHDSVFYEKKIIYTLPGQNRELFIPELKNNIRGGKDERFNWFVHWYVVDRNTGDVVDREEANITFSFIKNKFTEKDSRLQGGDWSGFKKKDGSTDISYGSNNAVHTTEDYFVRAFTNKRQKYGWIWSKRLRDKVFKQPNNEWGGGYGMDVSVLYFTIKNFDPSKKYDIYCDVSIYQDGAWTESTDNSDILGTYTEPTLTKRYKFQLEDANTILNRDVEEFEFDYPYSAQSELQTINFTMPYAPDNYFWEVDNNIVQGKKFLYQYENQSNLLAFRLSTRNNQRIPLQQVQRIVNKSVYQADTPIKITVFVSDAKIESTNNSDTDQETGNKKEVAKFTFYPKENTGFMLAGKELNNKSERWPRKDKNRYRQIGHVSFDNNEVNNTITKENNMADKPFGYFENNWMTYGFLDKNAYTLDYSRLWDPKGDNLSNTNNQNIYGLFRSANLTKISVGLDNNSSISGSYLNGSTNISWKRLYLWPATNTNYAQLSDKNNRILYDRTAEVSRDDNVTQTPKEYGYFYYIDASNDPGTLVEVPVDNICPNTELTVTAWVADMTRPSFVDGDQEKDGYKPLAPNINLLFKGVKSDNTETILHRFTSCDGLTDYQNKGVDNKLVNLNLVKWQQLCYSFVISENLDDYKSFYLAIQNNEPHTDGADYAIDDIRIFKTIPDIKVVQSGNPCDEKIKTVKFKTNYKMLLRNFGLTEGQPIDPNIAIPLSFDEYSELPDEHALKKYFKDKNEREIKEALQYFTTIYYAIYNAKEEDGEIKPNGSPISIAYNGKEPSNYRTSYVSTRIEDMVWTDESASSATRNPEDGYITSTNVSINGELTANKTYIARVSKTSISGECEICSFFNSFDLEGVGDRIVVTQDDKAVDITEKLSGGKYTITGILKYNPNPNSDELIPVDDPKFDWFLGTWDEFVKPGTITANGKSYSIMEALQTAYHNDGEDPNDAIKNELKELEYTDANSKGTLILGKTSFDFTTTDGQKHWGVMFPRAQQNGLPAGAVICSDPHEFLLGGTPPTIEPGDPNVPDPEDPDPEDPDPKDPDKPKPDENPFDGSHVRSVRVGLVQIQDMQQHGGTLRIPIHVRTSLDNEKFAKQDGENKSDIIVYKTSDGTWNSNTAVVATLEKLADEEKKADWKTNYFTVKFTEKAKEFKEGFWYMVGIPYKVIDTDNNNNDVYVDRVFMLTLKIVPEYVTWVGSAENMHNWNNDGPKHWRRSNDAELYTTSVASANGTHNEAYTPMRFTKVTIYGNKENKPYSAYPHLYELKKQSQSLILDMATTDKTIGAATKNIEYDLLADPDYEQELFGNVNNPDKTQDHSYACVRFYGNACDEIYIKPESEILHTEYLTYNKAHVDYEMDPNRWYMLASPLKGVVSGDMYLPTGTETPKVGNYARQETPAFDNINYNTTDYTRWKPAVYMRGWDKTTATVVRSDDTKPSYGIKGSWSNLYNDVDVPFTPGTGFSVGTKTDKATTSTNGKVLFRLPKADGEYTYYGNGETTGGNITTIKEDNRAGNGRFHISPDEKGQNVVESCSASSTGGMFGNPFMSHLDMEKFFEKNNSSENVYYIMGKSATKTVLFGDNYTLSTGTDDNGQYVAPLQSFIVKDLPLATFNTDMIAKAPANGTNVGLRSATVAPAEEPLPQLRITATRDGVRNTAVVAGLATASDSYVEGEDAALLINEEVAAPQVYTLAGNQMVAINVTPDLAEIPVGIHGKDATPVELSFKLSGAMKNVKLVDKQTGKRYDVTDGLTLTVPGNTYGRYFLNGSIATSNEIIARNHIIFYNSAPGRIDVSSVDALSEVTVYDIAGRALRTLRNLNTPTASVDHLAPGIYVVRAESGSQVVSEKVEVK